MPVLPQVRINGRAFILDDRLGEIRAALNPHEIYRLDQDVIPPSEAPPFHLPTDAEPQNGELAYLIADLPEADVNIEPVFP